MYGYPTPVKMHSIRQLASCQLLTRDIPNRSCPDMIQ